MTTVIQALLTALCAVLLACAGGGDSAPGAPDGGAAAGSGGASAGSGGMAPGTGGGGGGPAGGATETGGGAASGGATGTGGRAASGGATGTGGGGAMAGATGTTGGSGGGSGAAGGTQPAPFKGVTNPPCADLTRMNVAWWYNWTLTPGNCATPEFVPMIAGKSEKTAAAVTSALTRVAAAGYRTVLGFNEPNKADQSNLTVAQVVAMWPALTANPGVRVGSPATSADAQSWFNDFMAQVTAMNLRVDFIALHWYGWNAGSCDAKAATLESYIKWAEAIPGNRPIWLTEWGCLNLSNPDPATVQSFYAGALAMFARHPRIERYAWYPFTPNNELVTTGGALTPLGMTLSAAPATR